MVAPWRSIVKERSGGFHQNASARSSFHARIEASLDPLKSRQHSLIRGMSFSRTSSVSRPSGMCLRTSIRVSMLIGAPIGRHVKTLHRRADEWVLTGDTHTEATSNPIWGLFFRLPGVAGRTSTLTGGVPADVTPGRGDFWTSENCSCPSPKNLSKNGFCQKGGSLSEEDVFAKKFSGAGEDSAVGACVRLQSRACAEAKGAVSLTVA